MPGNSHDIFISSISDLRRDMKIGGEKMNKKYLGIILIVAIIIIASVAYIFTDKPANDNPEDTVTAFFQYINDQEPEAATDMTITKFSTPEDYEETVEHYEPIGAFYQYEVHDITVIQSEDMAPDYKVEMQNLTHFYENEYNITIDDYCYLNFSTTYNYFNGEIEDMGFNNMGCLQVDGLWYMCTFRYYGIDES